MSSPLDAPTMAVSRERPRTLLLPRIRLRVVKGPDRGAEATLEKEEVQIGTAPGCDLVLSDPTVSRHHCLLRASEAGTLLRDLASTNGTLLEAIRVREAFVPAGGVIEIGRTRVKFMPQAAAVEVPLCAAESLGRLVGRSTIMRRLFAVIEQVAATEATVLIEGETGTGKDAVADAIHQHSARRDGPFVVVDCGAIPPQLMEAELFGYERGAFTGAEARRLGALEEADSGTIFLDEVGELPLSLQPKLLRVLEQREVKRIGSNQTRRIQVRVVAATNRDLREAVNRGAFRQDLFYRLDVVRLRLPPLRERPEDIPALVEHFRQSLGGLEAPPLPADLLQHFASHGWPGNVRELRNAVERALVLGESRGAMDRLRSGPAEPGSDAAAGDQQGSDAGVRLDLPFKECKAMLLEAFERRYLRALLTATAGNLSEAARRAGLDRVYLLKLAKKHGLRGR